MSDAKFAALVKSLKAPDHVETLPLLVAASKATGNSLTASEAIDMMAKFGPIIDFLLALFKKQQKPEAPTQPLPPVPPVVIDDEEEDAPTKPVPAQRKIAGVAVAKWFHFQEGPAGKVQPMNKARFDSICDDSNPLNGDLKSRLVADVTPKMSDGSSLLPGQPENAQVDARYAVVFDGVRYEQDEIKDSPVVLNNLDANFRLTPRFVLGPGIDGNHTFRAEVNLNGTGWVVIKKQGGVDELRIS